MIIGPKTVHLFISMKKYYKSSHKPFLSSLPSDKIFFFISNFHSQLGSIQNSIVNNDLHIEGLQGNIKQNSNMFTPRKKVKSRAAD